LGHYFIPVDKKNAVTVRIHFQNDQHKCVFSLGIAFAKHDYVGLGGSVLVGKWVTLKTCGACFQIAIKVEVWGECDARARLVCPEIVSRSVKEVAINCGWVNEARAGRILPFKTDVFPVVNLLVVTVFIVWFNFRGWKKRP
jgi:hypothetical protein